LFERQARRPRPEVLLNCLAFDRTYSPSPLARIRPLKSIWHHANSDGGQYRTELAQRPGGQHGRVLQIAFGWLLGVQARIRCSRYRGGICALTARADTTAGHPVLKTCLARRDRWTCHITPKLQRVICRWYAWHSTGVASRISPTLRG
jgi:hypothetical protein